MIFVCFILFSCFVIFVWNQSFSAVVGPNGSGKSNVIDAMLFVFGKRAKQVGKSFALCYEFPFSLYTLNFGV